MEAYNAIYASHEVAEDQIQEDFETWVNSLVEEGYDLSEYTWDEMYEAYISEASKPDPRFIAKASAGGQTAFRAGGGAAALRQGKSAAEIQKAGMAAFRGAGGQTAFRAGGGQAALRSGQSVTDVQKQGERNLFKAGGGTAQMQKTGQTPAQVAAQGSKNIATAAYKAGGGNAQAVKTGQTPAQVAAQGAKNLGAAFKAGGGYAKMQKTGLSAQDVIKQGSLNIKNAPKPAPAPAGSPAAGKPPAGSPAAGKPPAGAPAAGAPAAAKPTPAAKPQLGPTGKPLVGGIERRTPTRAEMDAAAAKRTAAASPSSAIQAAGQSAGQKAFSTPVKPSTTTTAFKAPTIDVATKPDTSNVKQVNQAAAAPKPITPNPSATSTKPGDGKPYKDGPLWEETVDIFDIVMEYLISEGYAETEDAAVVIMANMSEEWKQSIVEQQVVSDPGGKGGKVTAGKEYPAVYSGQKGMKFTSVTGQRYFTPDSKGFAKTTPSK